MNQVRETKERQQGLPHGFAFVVKRSVQQPAAADPARVPEHVLPAQSAHARNARTSSARRSATPIKAWPEPARVAVVASGWPEPLRGRRGAGSQAARRLEKKDAETLKALPKERLFSATSESLNWIAVGGAMEKSRSSPTRRLRAGVSHARQTGGGWAFSPLAIDTALLAEPEYRVEGPLKVTGAARYTADVRRPGMLWVAYMRSPLPHARIVSVETSAARQVPGVHAVLTGADSRPMPASAGACRTGRAGPRSSAVHRRPRRRGRGRDPAAAEEACRLVEVDYEELPAADLARGRARAGCADPARASRQYAYFGAAEPLAHPNMQGQLISAWAPRKAEPRRSRAPRTSSSTPSARRASTRATSSRTPAWCGSTPTARCHVARPTRRRSRCASSSPRTLGLPEEQIAVDSAYIGGDFGGKGPSLDEYTCYFLARATGRPVKAQMRYVDELARPIRATRR